MRRLARRRCDVISDRHLLACYSCRDYGIIRSDHTASRSITSLVDWSMDRVRSGGFHLVSQSSRNYHGFRTKRQRSWMKRNETKRNNLIDCISGLKWNDKNSMHLLLQYCTMFEMFSCINPTGQRPSPVQTQKLMPSFLVRPAAHPSSMSIT